MGIWANSSRWLEVVLPRPKIAFAYITAVLIIGVFAGSVTAQAKANQLNAALRQRYVQSIDPYRGEMPQP